MELINNKRRASMTREFSFETLQLHAGQSVDPTTKSRAVPIYQTTSYVFNDAQDAENSFALRTPGNIYTRITNPTTAVFEERMAALEGGVGALATASGMAAVTYIALALAHAGDHIVSATTVYGGTFNLLKETLPRYGITTSFVDVANFAEIETAITDKTKFIIAETLGNPLAHVILRGALDEYGKNKPNFYYENLLDVIKCYEEMKLSNPFILIDTNHDNSGKQYLEQIRIIRQTLINRAWNEQIKKAVRGFMIESYLEDGRQNEPEVFGKSITDPCLGWDKTEELIQEIYETLEKEA